MKTGDKVTLIGTVRDTMADNQLLVDVHGTAVTVNEWDVVGASGSKPVHTESSKSYPSIAAGKTLVEVFTKEEANKAPEVAVNVDMEAEYAKADAAIDEAFGKLTDAEVEEMAKKHSGEAQFTSTAVADEVGVPFSSAEDTAPKKRTKIKSLSKTL